MGYYTWTDARKKPTPTKDGYDWLAKDKIPYGGYAKVVCPDDTEIIENYYDGYGMFGGYDIYDLVAEWNKDDLKEIFSRFTENDFGYGFKKVAEMFADGISDDEITEYVRQKVGDDSYLVKEWKRHIGISISCNDEDNDALKYPIKITTLRQHRKYSELYPSYNTQ